jgi:hypothetical protein
MKGYEWMPIKRGGKKWEAKSFDTLFNTATGKELDAFGEYVGVKRKRWLFFKEPDFFYKTRIIEAVDKRQKPPTV